MDTLRPHLHCRVRVRFSSTLISRRAWRQGPLQMPTRTWAPLRRPDSPPDNRYHQPARQPGR